MANGGTEEIEYCGVRLTPDILAEVDGGRIMVRVPRGDVRGATVRYGIRASHPIAQTLAGSALAALGLVPALHLLDRMKHGGKFVSSVIWLVPMAVIGITLVLGALRRGYFLDLDTPGGRKRLLFIGHVDPTELRAFVAVLESRLGMTIAITADALRREGVDDAR